MKKCTKCLETKPMEEYYKRKTKGSNPRCKVCNKEYVRIWKANNRGRYYDYKYATEHFNDIANGRD